MKKEQIKKEDLMNASGGMRRILFDLRPNKDDKNALCGLEKYKYRGENQEIYEGYNLYRLDDKKKGDNLSFIAEKFESEEDLINWIEKNEIKYKFL